MRPGLAMHVCLVVAGLLIVACQRGEAPTRCAKCGMAVDENPRWIAAVVHADGREQRFCSPRCLSRWMEGESWTGAAWVTDYYTLEHVALEDVLFVTGSDVTGPMGGDRVPVRGLTAARQFLEDHGGDSILRPDGTKVEPVAAPPSPP